MLKTLGLKHRSTVSKMAARHKAKIETSDGLRTCFEARKHREGRKDLVARFGGIILRQNRRAVITDPASGPPLYPRKELTRRLRKRECELCETGTTVAVHQVTGLKDLGKPGPGQPAWAAPPGGQRLVVAHVLVVVREVSDGLIDVGEVEVAALALARVLAATDARVAATALARPCRIAATARRPTRGRLAGRRGAARRRLCRCSR